MMIRSKLTILGVGLLTSAAFALAPGALAHPGGGMGGGMGGPPAGIGSNAGGAMHGLDRADVVAGSHGDAGRDSASLRHSAIKTKTHSNKHGALHGLTRADAMAGAHGDKGRDNAGAQKLLH